MKVLLESGMKGMVIEETTLKELVATDAMLTMRDSRARKTRMTTTTTVGHGLEVLVAAVVLGIGCAVGAVVAAVVVVVVPVVVAVGSSRVEDKEKTGVEAQCWTKAILFLLAKTVCKDTTKGNKSSINNLCLEEKAAAAATMSVVVGMVEGL